MKWLLIAAWWMACPELSLAATEEPQKDCADQINEHGFPSGVEGLEKYTPPVPEPYRGMVDENGNAILEFGDGTVGEQFDDEDASIDGKANRQSKNGTSEGGSD